MSLRSDLDRLKLSPRLSADDLGGRLHAALLTAAGRRVRLSADTQGAAVLTLARRAGLVIPPGTADVSGALHAAALVRLALEQPDGRALAMLYADLFTLLSAAGVDIPDEEVDAAGEELEGTGWLVVRRAGGSWQVVPAEGEGGGGVRLSWAVRLDLAATDPWHAYQGPRGGRGWRNAVTGRIVYGANKPGSGAALQKRIAEGKRRNAEARAARGPADVGQLAARLQKHRDEAAPGPSRSAKLAYHALYRHHGELTGSRLSELAGLLESALDKPNLDPGVGAQIRQRLAGLHWMASELSGGRKPQAAPKGPKGPWTGGKPDHGKVYNAPTAQLAVDPERFQFKLNVNKAGVTEELLGVKKWNPDFAGVLSVWQDPEDGKTYVVNGHHRRELAGRLKVDSLAVRYINAKTAKEARAVGALVNIAEGRGTAVDAAKFMRDMGVGVADMEKQGVSLKGRVAADAVVLTDLNDRLFDRVARGTLDPAKALLVSRHLKDHDLQDQLFRLLDRREDEGKDLSPKVVEEMAKEMAQTPTRKVTEEGGLFGDIESEESLFVPRNEVKAHVRGELAKEVNDFLAVASKRRAEKVGAAGNVLDVAQNRKIAEEAERVRNAYDTLVNRKGDISDAVNAAAADYAKAKSKKERDAAKQRAVESVRAAVFAEAGIGPDAGGKTGGAPGGGAAAEAGGPAAGAAPGDEGRGAPGAAGLTGLPEGAADLVNPHRADWTVQQWAERHPTLDDPGDPAQVRSAVAKALESGIRLPPSVLKEHADVVREHLAGKQSKRQGREAQMRAIPVGDIGRVGGWDVRRTGENQWRLETDTGHVAGGADAIHEHLDRDEGRRHLDAGYREALARTAGWSEPDVFAEPDRAQADSENFAKLPKGTRVVSLDPATRGRVGTVTPAEEERPDGTKFTANRVKLDGGGWASYQVEPLDRRLSWRAGESAAEPAAPKAEAGKLFAEEPTGKAPPREKPEAPRVPSEMVDPGDFFAVKPEEGRGLFEGEPERPKAKATEKPAAEHAGLEVSRGLSPEEAKIERDTQIRAREQYGDLKEKYLRGGGGKEAAGTFDDKGEMTSVVLNTDEFRDLFPEYTGTNAGAVHEASSYLNKQVYGEMLQEMKGKGNGRLMILAGGGGSGKGTAVGQYFEQSEYPLRLDQVSDNLKKLEAKLDEAKAHGYEPEYIFVDRHPADAWGGVVGRAAGLRKKGKPARTVPLDVALHANLKARETAIELLKKRKDIQPNVIDNNHGYSKAVLIKDRDEAIKFLEAQNHDHEKLLNQLRDETQARYESGELDEDIARGLLGRHFKAKGEKEQLSLDRRNDGCKIEMGSPRKGGAPCVPTSTSTPSGSRSPRRKG